MPTNFTRPTLTALIARVQTDIEGEIAGVSARLRRRFELGLARAVAGVAHHLHGHIAWVAEQIIVDQASERFVLRWADFFGVVRKPATPAHHMITVTSSGTYTLPAGSVFVRVADGARYTVDAPDVEIAPDADVPVTAVDGGLAGNMVVGQKVQLESPITGINSEATVAGDGFVSGVDVESIEALLARTLDRIQHPPMGGAAGDHVTWALEVSGVSRAWEYPRKDASGADKPGTVSIAFVTDVIADDGIPSGDMLEDVQLAVQAKSPAEVQVIELEAAPLIVSILLDPTAAADAVKAAIEDFINRTREPGGTIYLSQLSEAISGAAGETRHEIVTPATDIPVEFGEIATYAEPTINPFS